MTWRDFERSRDLVLGRCSASGVVEGLDLELISQEILRLCWRLQDS
jgi:hypothetical protein